MNELRIDVADLLTHPAARRPFRLDAPVAGLEGSAARIETPVHLDLVLERVSDGIVARGTVSARYDAECGTCLQPVSADVEVAVSELYEDAPVDGETYPIEGHVIDLEQLVRDSLLLELPLAPTCSSAGRPACAADPDPHADADLDDTDAPADPRWSALSRLEL